MTEVHALSAAEVRLVQVIPSGLVITRFPVPFADTATKSPAPYVTEVHALSAADVLLDHASGPLADAEGATVSPIISASAVNNAVA